MQIFYVSLMMRVYKFQWGITCLENQWKLSLVGTFHFAGILVGSVLCGYLADRYKLYFDFYIPIYS